MIQGRVRKTMSGVQCNIQHQTMPCAVGAPSKGALALQHSHIRPQTGTQTQSLLHEVQR